MLLAVVRFDARQAASTVSYTVLIFMLFFLFCFLNYKYFKEDLFTLSFRGILCIILR